MPGFGLHGARRPSRTLHCVGGKAVNFARVVRRLGHEARVLGISAGHAGRFMEESLDSEGIPHRMIRAPRGESRLATTIMDPATGVHTEVNEAGPTIDDEVVGGALQAFDEMLPGSRYCVIAGSAPPGAPDDIYARMIATCHEHGVPVMLDASRNWLLGAAGAGPTVLKPNEKELGTLLGRQVDGAADAAEAARELACQHIDTVLVTLGEEGAVGVTANECLRVHMAEPPEILSAVASGDAFAAGYVAGLLEGRDLSGRLALAAACGTANAQVFGPGYIEREDAEILLDRIVVGPLGLASDGDVS